MAEPSSGTGFWVALAGAAGVIATKFVDLIVHRRSALSAEEQSFRASVQADNEALRREITAMHAQMGAAWDAKNLAESRALDAERRELEMGRRNAELELVIKGAGVERDAMRARVTEQQAQIAVMQHEMEQLRHRIMAGN